jgi:hypothetical protein
MTVNAPQWPAISDELESRAFQVGQVYGQIGILGLSLYGAGCSNINVGDIPQKWNRFLGLKEHAQISRFKLEKIVKGLEHKGVQVTFGEVEPSFNIIPTTGRQIINLSDKPIKIEVLEEIYHRHQWLKFLGGRPFSSQIIVEFSKRSWEIQDEIKAMQWLLKNSSKFELTAQDMADIVNNLNYWQKQCNLLNK